MKSKTKIQEQTIRKKNPELVKTITAAKKNKNWISVASILSGPRKKRININLDEINREAKEGENVVIPGKVLGQGKINKKIKIIALDFSEKATEKLKEAKIDFNLILKEIKSNPEAKGLKILK